MTTQQPTLTERQPTLTEIRHGTLRHHLTGSEAALVATVPWVVDRVHHYAALAGVAPVEAFTDAPSYAARTGRRISPNCWGQADWATGRRLVYVDPAKCRTRGAAELVTAHEIGHLRWPRARHTRRFFEQVQALLDTRAKRLCAEAEAVNAGSRSGGGTAVPGQARKRSLS